MDPGAPWPATLPEETSSRLSELPCLKNTRWDLIKEDISVHLEPPHSHEPPTCTHLHKHVIHHTHTHEQERR